MKFIIVSIFSVLVSNFSFSQNNTAVASCCESKEGRCVGSAYCSACTNCSRCRHCSAGGSCGVCSSRYRSAPKRSSSKQSNSYTYGSKTTVFNLPNDTSSKNYLKSLIVDTKVLNLRSGPGTSYSILEVLSKNQRLTFLARKGSWVKVRVVSTKTIGFVYYKYVLVSKG